MDYPRRYRKLLAFAHRMAVGHAALFARHARAPELDSLQRQLAERVAAWAARDAAELAELLAAQGMHPSLRSGAWRLFQGAWGRCSLLTTLRFRWHMARHLLAKTGLMQAAAAELARAAAPEGTHSADAERFAAAHEATHALLVEVERELGIEPDTPND